MPDETTWPIDEHTRAKHEILRRYLGAWFPILTIQGSNLRVIFLDGFAGPGRYSGGEPGSPLIALETLVTHTAFAQMSRTEFIFLFVENDRDRFENLQNELEKYWKQKIGGQPQNIGVYTYNKEFTEMAQQILDHTQGKIAPTFAFIDPFGWSGVPMTTIRDLLSSRKCEVLFNFMYDSLNRFIADERSGIVNSFNLLFGTESNEHMSVEALSGEKRKEFLVDLYKEQLRTVGGFRFVRSFELMNPGRGRTQYCLMFGTRHHRGLQAMKEAMWALDPVTGVQFQGFAGNQLMLFEPEPNTEPLRTALLHRFGNQSASIETIERFVAEETDYLTTHHKRVLKGLENEGLVICLSERKRGGTYPAGTVLRLASADKLPVDCGPEF